MAQESRQYELILLGPTGYTGQFIAEWISTRLPEDLKWAIAGRNAKKLQGVVDELTKLSPNRKQPDIEICELKKEELVPLVKKARLVITAVGPYMHYGEPVVAACAETGTHYLDCTGEVPWIYEMVEKYDEIAKKNGAIIIPECGYDSVPADLTTYAVVNHIRKTFGAGTEKLVLSLYAIKTGVSGGTSLTMVQLFENYSLTHLGKSMRPFSLSPVKPTQPSSAPKGSLFYRLLGLLNLPELGGIQTVGLMAGVDACIVHRSWGLYEAAAKAVSRPNLSYGTKFRFTEYMRAKNFLHGLIVRLGLTFTSFLLVFPPSRWIFAPLLRNFVIPKPGQGPARDSLKKDFVTFKVMGIADNEKKDQVLGRLDCAHGAYSLTGLTLAAAAHVILRGRLEETEAGRRGGGILTPATLGEQYLERLDEYGFKISVGK